MKDFPFQRYAVCVGINDYPHLPTLQFAEADAQAMDDVLADLEFPKENRRLLLGEDATSDRIIEAVSDYIVDKPTKDDLVVFYFAGHSVPVTISTQLHSGQQDEFDVYLADFSFSEDLIRQITFRRDRSINLRSLRDNYFQRSKSLRLLFILDSCHSGAFGDTVARNGLIKDVDQYVENQLLAGFSSAVREQPQLVPRLGELQVRHTLRLGYGRTALTSGMPHQEAREDHALGHGRMTYYILQALRGYAPEAQLHNGRVTISSLHQFLCEQMPEDQIPGRYGSWYGLEIPLAEFTPRQLIDRHVINNAQKINSHMTKFVGRSNEIEEIDKQVKELARQGGHLILIGDKGQGKTALVSALIVRYGIDKTVHHFVPKNPGDYEQIILLRNLIAQVLDKYKIERSVAFDDVTSLNRQFLELIELIGVRSDPILIFIDEIDRVIGNHADLDKLGFLTAQVPPNIVFVVSAVSIEKLPEEFVQTATCVNVDKLSRADFDALIQKFDLQEVADWAPFIYSTSSTTEELVGHAELLRDMQSRSNRGSLVIIGGIDDTTTPNENDNHNLAPTGGYISLSQAIYSIAPFKTLLPILGALIILVAFLAVPYLDTRALDIFPTTEIGKLFFGNINNTELQTLQRLTEIRNAPWLILVVTSGANLSIVIWTTVLLLLITLFLCFAPVVARLTRRSLPFTWPKWTILATAILSFVMLIWSRDHLKLVLLRSSPRLLESFAGLIDLGIGFWMLIVGILIVIVGAALQFGTNNAGSVSGSAESL